MIEEQPTLITPLITYSIDEWNRLLDECSREVEGSCYRFISKPGSLLIFHCEKNENNFEYREELGKIYFSFEIDNAIIYSIEKRSGYTLKAISDVLAKVEINVFGRSTDSLKKFSDSLKNDSSISWECR